MIQAAVCEIAQIVLSSGYVNTHFEYCEIIRVGDVSYPAQYVSGGNYEQVFNNDVNGNSYLRRNGKMRMATAPAPYNKKYRSCGDNPFALITVPFRLVMVVPKDKLADDAFSDDRLATDIIALISGASSINVVGVIDPSYEVEGYDTDSLSIWNEEVKGQQYQMNFQYSYVAINFNLTAIANPACLLSSCY